MKRQLELVNDDLPDDVWRLIVGNLSDETDIKSLLNLCGVCRRAFVWLKEDTFHLLRKQAYVRAAIHRLNKKLCDLVDRAMDYVTTSSHLSELLYLAHMAVLETELLCARDGSPLCRSFPFDGIDEPRVADIFYENGNQVTPFIQHPDIKSVSMGISYFNDALEVTKQKKDFTRLQSLLLTLFLRYHTVWEKKALAYGVLRKKLPLNDVTPLTSIKDVVYFEHNDEKYHLIGCPNAYIHESIYHYCGKASAQEALKLFIAEQYINACMAVRLFKLFPMNRI
jgi:hypothetical protein